MKKFIVLCAFLLFTAIPAYAEYATVVSYTPTTEEYYVITVPATLSPGSTGVVTVTTAFPSNKTLSVTTDNELTLSSSIGSTTSLGLSFPGVSLSGSNTTSVYAEEYITLDTLDYIFGTWSGIIHYNVNWTEPPKTLGEYAVGESVYLNVDDMLVEFLVVHQGNPDDTLYDASCDGTWLLMANTWDNRVWHSSSSTNYTKSNSHNYLNKTFVTLFDEEVQTYIKEVKIPYQTKYNTYDVTSGSDGLVTKAFYLSAAEAGFTVSCMDGACLDYFADPNHDVLNSMWWTRTPSLVPSSQAWVVTSADEVDNAYKTIASYSRPALIFSSDMLVQPVITQSLKSFSVGECVTIQVGGKPTSFIVVNQGNPDPAMYDDSCDDTWLLARDVYEDAKWHGNSFNFYEESTINNYLNTTFLSSIEANVKPVIIPYKPRNNPVATGTDGLSTSVFLLSLPEVGVTTVSTNNMYIDGVPLQYFTEDAYSRDIDDIWYLRSTPTTNSTAAWKVNATGEVSTVTVYTEQGIRPAFILDSNTSFVKLCA